MKKYLLLIACFSCSSAHERIEENRMKNNVSLEKIYRLSSEKIYKEDNLILVKRDLYPWENDVKFPRITMDSFRCRGACLNKKVGEEKYEDCRGLQDHGLPYVDGEEFVYPVLVNLLNEIQKRLERKVVITSGHRCPKHDKYLMGKLVASKYMIGAKVDFYVEGLELTPDIVIKNIRDAYNRGDACYRQFQKIISRKGNAIWKNKEISLSIEEKGEHSILQKLDHPVISLEVNYDRKKNRPIEVTWEKANYGFIIN